jgi:hypothetical protein
LPGLDLKEGPPISASQVTEIMGICYIPGPDLLNCLKNKGDQTMKYHYERSDDNNVIMLMILAFKKIYQALF